MGWSLANLLRRLRSAAPNNLYSLIDANCRLSNCPALSGRTESSFQKNCPVSRTNIRRDAVCPAFNRHSYDSYGILFGNLTRKILKGVACGQTLTVLYGVVATPC